MATTKVELNVDLERLKSNKRLLSQVCCVDGCSNIGAWDSRKLIFCLKKGMCNTHYIRQRRNGDVNNVARIRDGHGKHPLYHVWNTMKQRCLNKNSQKYSDYGARGITVCDDWIEPKYGFLNFIRDMGDCPIGYSLERIKNNLGYCKDNCRWATKHEQGANKRNNKKNIGVYASNLKFRAKLAVNGSIVLDQTFATEIEAINARKEAEIKYNIMY